MTGDQRADIEPSRSSTDRFGQGPPQLKFAPLVEGPTVFQAHGDQVSMDLPATMTSV